MPPGLPQARDADTLRRIAIEPLGADLYVRPAVLADGAEVDAELLGQRRHAK